MIGIFDSGSGGLSVASILRKKAPDADFVYFGDVANAPYGEKDLSELSNLTEKGIELLKRKGMTQLLSACNTVSSAVLAGVSQGIPFIEMSMPTASYLQQFRGKRFLLMATPATVASGLYTKAVNGMVKIDALSMPGLAGAIEFGASEDDIENIIGHAFASRKGERYDGIILGCTHYPLVRDLIEPLIRTYFGKIKIIDPAFPVVDEVIKNFDIEGIGISTFVISKENADFNAKVKSLFSNDSYTISFEGSYES